MCLVIGLNVIGEEQNTFTIFDNPEYFPEVAISKIEELKGKLKDPNIEVYCVRGSVMVVVRDPQGLSAIQLLDPDVSPPRPMSCSRYIYDVYE